MADVRERLAIADEIVRRIDTITITKVEEVADIRRRALAGEFDNIFADETDRAKEKNG